MNMQAKDDIHIKYDIYGIKQVNDGFYTHGRVYLNGDGYTFLNVPKPNLYNLTTVSNIFEYDEVNKYVYTFQNTSKLTILRISTEVENQNIQVINGFGDLLLSDTSSIVLNTDGSYLFLTAKSPNSDFAALCRWPTKSTTKKSICRIKENYFYPRALAYIGGNSISCFVLFEYPLKSNFIALQTDFDSSNSKETLTYFFDKEYRYLGDKFTGALFLEPNRDYGGVNVTDTLFA